MRKYGDIWKIKRALQQQDKPSELLLGMDNRYFLKGYGGWISFRSKISGVPFFPHEPIGVFISGDAQIGRNAIIFQHVSVGSDALLDSSNQGSPVIGDNIYIGAGAKIIGGIHNW